MKKSAKREPVRVVEVKSVAGGDEPVIPKPGDMGNGGNTPIGG
jgi:hypothetical protein